MEQQANEDRDYDEIRGKLKRHDKNGNDITGDNLGGGGRHRSDGSISALVYDIETIDSVDDNSELARYELESQLANYAHEEELARLQKEQSDIDLANNVLLIVNNILVFLEEHPEVAVKIAKGGKKAISTIKKQTNKMFSSIKGINKKKSKKSSTKLQTVRDSALGKLKEIHQSESLDDYGEEMTLEQAQTEYIEIFKDFLRIRKRAERLANAHIVDANVKKFDLNHNLALMNSLVEKYPALLDDKIQFQIIEMLRASNAFENHAILSVLNIDSKNEKAYENSP
ncbi:MAG: hypothetical protein K2K21_06020 [Lachnospiraceae bacterium]|nr:hypothetical protein [Lachnospiraceae bacterium]